jgi:hypothetical protein
MPWSLFSKLFPLLVLAPLPVRSIHFSLKKLCTVPNSMESNGTYDEKHLAQDTAPSGGSNVQLGTTEDVDLAAIPKSTSKLQRLANRLEAIVDIEARGIERVPESERERKYAAKAYLYMAMIWFSANCTANNMTVRVRAMYLRILLDLFRKVTR